MPLPYPHRATFLASTLHVSSELAAVAPHVARLVSLITFDHLVRHPMLTLGDHDDERLVDESGHLLDANHAQLEDSMDWFFRVSRRHEVLWFELSLDPARPLAPVLRSRRPGSPPHVDEWRSTPELALGEQLDQLFAHWLAARRLPRVPALAPFTLDDLRTSAVRLAKADAQLGKGVRLGQLPAPLVTPPEYLTVPYLRVLAELAGPDGRALDPMILEIDPAHVVARRNRYVTALVSGEVDRRAILPLVHDAPMYGKPHLSVWGESFSELRPLEGMGVRHQGIAASLMPANPYACHNYSLQLAEAGRREESYRWSDRATVAAPHFGAAHLDCVRRLRQIGRPGQAFAEAQYRCREILDRAAANKLAPSEWQAPHHAALLIAFAHLDVGRIAEAIELANDAMSRLPDDPHAREAFAWAEKRIAHWKTDAGLLARAFAWEGFHRADPGRTIMGLSRARITDDEDAMMLIEALVTIGREDQAEVAFHHCEGLDVMGDGKARLAAAKALILRGNVDLALDQIQIVQQRRPQSRLEAEINRLLRLAATRPAADWARALEDRLARGATTLAQRAARDLADFVPGMDTPLVARALGERHPIVLPAGWLDAVVAALPDAGASAEAIIARLAVPSASTQQAADALAAEWYGVLVPPTRDRDAHAAGAVLALAIALASYFVAAARPPTPIAGAYRHIATEALHLVRRSRYQIGTDAIEALLRVVEMLGDAPEWLLDTWLLRIERALDLEAEHGSYLDGMIATLPKVQRLLRGDERIGWELRLAHDLAEDPSQYEPAAMLFARCSRACEGGTVDLAWSHAAAAGAARAVALDVHWLAALSNPTGIAQPHLAIARHLLGTAHSTHGFAAACRAVAATLPMDRLDVIDELAPAWRRAKLATSLDSNTAFEDGLAAASEDRLDEAVSHLRWAAAVEPTNAKRAQSLAVALGRLGRGLEAVQVLAAHERLDAPRLIGRVLLDAGREVEALPILRFAARRFRTADDWATLARAAHRAGDDAITIEAGKRALALGTKDVALLVAVATCCYRLGDFVDCERVAQQLIAEAGGREARLVGLHAMARALAGQGRHVDAHPYAKAANELSPTGPIAAELGVTLDHIVAQTTPPTLASPERSMDRRAYDELEAGKFELLHDAIESPSWGITRVALAASEFRTEDESGIPVAPRALDAAVTVLGRTHGATHPEAVLARIRALRIRDNAFIQIDPPPPLGLRYTRDELERAYAERDRAPQRPGTDAAAQRR